MAHKQKQEKSSLIYWLMTILLPCLLPVLTNVLLPAMGINVIKHRVDASTIPLIISLGFGILLYTRYLKFTLKHPVVPALYCVLLIQLVHYFFNLFSVKTGHSLPLKQLTALVVIIPTVVLLFKNFRYINEKYNYFKYLVTFFSLFLGYYFLFNLNFIDPTISLVSVSSISQTKLYDYFFTFVGLVLVAVSFRQARTAEAKNKLFNLFNLALITFGLLHGIATLIGFPLDIFTMVLEGFRRSTGLYLHPNEFGKIQGLLLIYYIGLFYHHNNDTAGLGGKLRPFLGVTIVINILTFLLSMSKSSFAGFGVACVLFFGLSLFDRKIRGKVLLPLILFGGFLVLTLWGYQAYSGHDLIFTITDRFNDTRSLRWRYSVWGYLLGNITSSSLWIGHGLTASNMELYRFLYNTNKQSIEQSIFVHNAFINFLYDMGISGMLIFSGFIAAGLHSMRCYFQRREPLVLSVVGLTLFLLMGSMMDECITSLNDCLVFWLLTTLIYSRFLIQPELSADSSIVVSSFQTTLTEPA